MIFYDIGFKAFIFTNKMEKFYEPGFIAGTASLLVVSVVAIYLWKKLKQAETELKNSQEKVVSISTSHDKSVRKIKELSKQVENLERQILLISGDDNSIVKKKKKTVSFEKPKKKVIEEEEDSDDASTNVPSEKTKKKIEDDNSTSSEKTKKEDDESEEEDDDNDSDSTDVDNDFNHVDD